MSAPEVKVVARSLQSNDMRTVEAMEAGDDRATMATRSLRTALKQSISASLLPQPTDAIVFTGGIGENFQPRARTHLRTPKA
jgi:acetate kinase